MGNFQIFFKKVQCRFPGYLPLKFCTKLTDSSPDHSAHLFLTPFWPLGGPLDRGGAKKILRQPFLTVTNIFKFGTFISSRLRDIDEKPSVREKNKKKQKNKN